MFYERHCNRLVSTGDFGLQKIRRRGQTDSRNQKKEFPDDTKISLRQFCVISKHSLLLRPSKSFEVTVNIHWDTTAVCLVFFTLVHSQHFVCHECFSKGHQFKHSNENDSDLVESNSEICVSSQNPQTIKFKVSEAHSLR